MTLLSSFPSDTAYPWHEDHHRIWCMYQARQKPGFNRDWFLIGSLNDLASPQPDEDPAAAARRLAYAYAMGMLTGFPDLLLLVNGRAIFIEQKKAPWGRPTIEQRDLPWSLNRNKFKAGIIKACPPAEA